MKKNSILLKATPKPSRYNKRWEDYAKSVRFRIKEVDLKSIRVTPKSSRKKHLLVP